MERGIQIGETEYPVRYGLSGTKEVLKLVGGKDLSAAAKLDKLALTEWPKFVHAGLKNAAKVEGEEPPTLEAVELAMDADISIFHTCLQIFGDDNTPKFQREQATDTNEEESGEGN